MHEIRSFKIRYTLQSFSNLLKNLNKTTALFVADSLYTEERIKLTEQFLNKNLKITLVPNKINRILFNSFKEGSLLNLLKGQVFLVEAPEKDFFSKEVLTNFLNSSKFFLRVIIVQKKIYRKDSIVKVLEKIITNQDFSFERQNIQVGGLSLLKRSKNFNI